MILKRRKNYKILIGILIGILLSATAVYATTKYASKNIYYINENSSLSSDNVQSAIDELADKFSNNKGCPKGYECFKPTTLSLGDYVSLTPTISSYTTDTSMTGYDSTQTIYPQELNLWRVISLNDNGTVDIISEHISSRTIYFQGQTGYQNFVGYLNVLASQYENRDYTIGSRYFGYNGQTEYITDTSKFTNAAPWTCSTGESCNPVENQGGGDTLYEKDYNLVKNVLGTTLATEPGDTSSSWYWIASRYYYYESTYTFELDERKIYGSGDMSEIKTYYSDYGILREDSSGASLRPILTLKSGLNYTGKGTSDSPIIPIIYGSN
jgi:hypothetical protein